MRQEFDFGEALRRLEAGRRVARWGWCSEDIYLYYVPGSVFTVTRPPLLGIYPEGTSVRYAPHIDVRAGDGRHAPWAPMMEDVLGKDWHEVVS